MSPVSVPPPGADAWYRRFQGLMPFRVREILLVSSAYDAFVLEEDGPLTDRLFTEYSELNLSWTPRMTHVASVAEALRLLGERPFDMVLTVIRLEDGDASTLAAQVSEQYPSMPVVLLVFDEGDIQQLPDGVPDEIERIFLWTGDARILIAAIKLIEDRRNAVHDLRAAGVQPILVVEDRIAAYSNFLALLYPELMKHARSLIAEGLNDLHKLMRMRARPKILLARTYEEALSLFDRFRDDLLALITDASFPRDGEQDPRAGIGLAQHARELRSDLPILLQSASQDLEAEAEQQLGARFASKGSPGFVEQLCRFLEQDLGFGEFVFRLPDQTEVARARDLYEMEEVLRDVPAESIRMHAANNDFSVWMNARCMFELADRIRPWKVEDFEDVEQARQYLLEGLREAREQEQQGIITDFSRHQLGPENRFTRLRRGSVGGKGRGEAFVASLIVHHGLLDRFEGLEIRIPKTIAIGTGAFDAFMRSFSTEELLELDDETITRKLLEGELDEELVGDLRTAFDSLDGPLAVRSSSLLEDSRLAPFAGVYATYMLPNADDDRDRAFDQLCRAIKAVYASTYWERARRYVRGTPHRIEDEKMAVLVQQLVGQRHGERFYPHAAGVAQSFNFYPVPPQTAEGGVAELVLGLGELAVEGGTVLRFSPATPASLPQFSTAEAFVDGSQRRFLAVDLSREVDVLDGPDGAIAEHGLDVAEQDGTLAFCGSVYSPEDDVLRDDLRTAGPRVVSFRNVLQHDAVPLAPALAEILRLLRAAMGCEVEIELALDMADWGKAVPASEQRPPCLYVLQVRPLATPERRSLDLDFDAVPDERVLCRSRRALGHGVMEDVCDVVYVRSDELTSRETRELVGRLRRLNESLQGEGRPYVLLGPGRWGSNDPTLGIPLSWGDIAGARLIVETPFGDRDVEPSQGTHFLQNLTSLGIGYITVRPEAQGMVAWDWLDASSAMHEDELIRHVRFERPIGICLDGMQGWGLVLRNAEELQGESS